MNKSIRNLQAEFYSATQGKPPAIYILDASVDVTGAFICARNAASLLGGFALVTLVIPDGSRIPEDELAPFTRILRLPVLNLRRSLRSLIAYFPVLFVVSWRLHRAMKADGADRLQLNDFYLMHGAVIRLLGFRGKIVTWIRFDPRRFGRFLSSLWLSLAARTSNRMVAVSRFIQGVLPAEMDTLLLYDTLPEWQERSTASPAATSKRARNLIYLGNYIDGKGQDDAISAFVQVAGRFSDLELHFYGGDMGLEKNRLYRSALEDMARKSGYGDRIRFHGFVKDAQSVLMSGYAALNFSRSESFSMTCLEACYCGLPVVATRSGGPAEIIVDGQTGLLVPVGDTAQMAEAIARLAADEVLARQFGEAAGRYVREKFSPERHRAELIGLFDLPTQPSSRGGAPAVEHAPSFEL